ncbi:hypothetical protein JW758_01375 [Candidatus Peregrinibacteria bacterium]|nr:hypothetical protein [Candidatus Peregrinibacteria bacterium]
MADAQRIETTLQVFGLNPECTRVAFVVTGEVTRSKGKKKLELVYACSSIVVNDLLRGEYRSPNSSVAQSVLELVKKDKRKLGFIISIVREGGLTHLIERDELNRLLKSITYQPELVAKYIGADENE